MPQLGIYHDDAIYVITARSLAEGVGYRALHLPGEPFQTKYPPLWPAVLALAWWGHTGYPEGLPRTMAICWAMLVFVGLASYWLFRTYGFAKQWSWLLASLIVLNPVAVTLSLIPMSELAFSGLLASTIVLLEKSTRQAGGPRLALGAGLLGGAAYLTRSAALPLLFTAPVCFWQRGQWKLARNFLAGFAPALIGWHSWTLAHQAKTANPLLLYYLDYARYHWQQVDLGDIPAWLSANVVAYVQGISTVLLFLIEPNRFQQMLASLVTVAAGAGAWRLARSTGCWQYLSFSLAYSTMLLFWHYPPGDRFVLPLLPLLMAGLATELARIASTLERAWKVKKFQALPAAVPVLLLLILLAGVALARWSYGLLQFPADCFRQFLSVRADNEAAWQWVKAHAPAVSVWLAGEAELFYLSTGRKAIGPVLPPRVLYRRAEDEVLAAIQNWLRYSRDLGVTYWLVIRSQFRLELPREGPPALERVVTSSPELQLVHQEGGFQIYRLVEGVR